MYAREIRLELLACILRVLRKPFGGFQPCAHANWKHDKEIEAFLSLAEALQLQVLRMLPTRDS